MGSGRLEQGYEIDAADLAQQSVQAGALDTDSQVLAGNGVDVGRACMRGPEDPGRGLWDLRTWGRLRTSLVDSRTWLEGPMGEPEGPMGKLAKEPWTEPEEPMVQARRTRGPRQLLE